jgi:archaellum component FlaC
MASPKDKHNGFTRLKSVDALDSASDDEYDDSIPLYRSSYACVCIKVCYHGVLILSVLLLLAFVVFGAYMVFQMQAEIGQLKQSLYQLQQNRNRSSGLDGSALSELRSTHFGVQANISRLAKLFEGNEAAIASLKKTVSTAGVEVDTKLIQFSAHSKQIKELTSVVQVLRNVIEHNFTAYVSQLTEDVRVLESRVGGMHQVVDAIKNGTDSCVEAIQEFSRGQGELLQDIYLLKHSNYTMTLEMSRMSKNVTNVQKSWAKAKQDLLLLKSTLQSVVSAVEELKALHSTPAHTSTINSTASVHVMSASTSLLSDTLTSVVSFSPTPTGEQSDAFLPSSTAPILDLTLSPSVSLSSLSSTASPAIVVQSGSYAQPGSPSSLHPSETVSLFHDTLEATFVVMQSLQSSLTPSPSATSSEEYGEFAPDHVLSTHSTHARDTVSTWQTVIDDDDEFFVTQSHPVTFPPQSMSSSSVLLSSPGPQPQSMLSSLVLLSSPGPQPTHTVDNEKLKLSLKGTYVHTSVYSCSIMPPLRHHSYDHHSSCKTTCAGHT